MSNKRDQINKIMKELVEFYTEDKKKLIYHLYGVGYTEEKIANILGVTRQAIHNNYPKGGEKK